MLLLSVIAIQSFAFNTPPDSTHAEKKVIKKVTDCNCNPVPLSSITVTNQGSTYLIEWKAPAGDPVSYYTYGGEYWCDGSFGPGTAYSEVARIANTCSDFTLSLITYCNNGCVSTNTIYYY